MRRIALEDGKWFDRDAAASYKEATRWDGRNHISRATGSQWNHEEIYRSRKGRWVLNTWSQWEGVGESYMTITQSEAYDWLLVNEHEIPEAEAVAREV